VISAIDGTPVTAGKLLLHRHGNATNEVKAEAGHAAIQPEQKTL